MAVKKSNAMNAMNGMNGMNAMNAMNGMNGMNANNANGIGTGSRFLGMSPFKDPANPTEAAENWYWHTNQWPEANPVAFTGQGLNDGPVRIQDIYGKTDGPVYDQRYFSPLNWALSWLGEFSQSFQQWGHDYRPAWAQGGTGWNLGPEVEEELTELTLLIEYRPAVMGECIAQINNVEDAYRGILSYSRLTHPATSKLVGLAEECSTLAVMHFKRVYARQRPSQMSPMLMPPIDPPEHASFPSGHATQSQAMSMVLRELMPDLTANHFGQSAAAPRPPLVRDPLQDMADRIGRNREVMGLHYRSDSVAGQALGADVFDTLKNHMPGLAQLWVDAAAEW